jgi:hypothetical protein
MRIVALEKLREHQREFESLTESQQEVYVKAFNLGALHEVSIDVARILG